jgi:hypothetical protein
MRSVPSDTPQIARMACRRAGSFGAVSLAALTAAGLREGLVASRAAARAALGADAEFLGDGWFWLPGARRNRLAVLGRRILAVASPLDTATVRAGVVRTYPYARAVLVPPEEVIAALFGAHPDFDVDALGRVRLSRELDYRDELGATDLIFVEALRASWTGVLDRASFLDACVARGMAARTFALRAPRSAVLDDPGGEIWCLRGTRVSPITAAALRHAKALTDDY